MTKRYTKLKGKAEFSNLLNPVYYGKPGEEIHKNNGRAYDITFRIDMLVYRGDEKQPKMTEDMVCLITHMAEVYKLNSEVVNKAFKDLLSADEFNELIIGKTTYSFVTNFYKKDDVIALNERNPKDFSPGNGASYRKYIYVKCRKKEAYGGPSLDEILKDENGKLTSRKITGEVKDYWLNEEVKEEFTFEREEAGETIIETRERYKNRFIGRHDCITVTFSMNYSEEFKAVYCVLIRVIKESENPDFTDRLGYYVEEDALQVINQQEKIEEDMATSITEDNFLLEE